MSINIFDIYSVAVLIKIVQAPQIISPPLKVSPPLIFYNFPGLP